MGNLSGSTRSFMLDLELSITMVLSLLAWFNVENCLNMHYI